MKNLKLVDGDLSFDSDGSLEMVSDDDELKQSLELILQIQLGEFDLDETVGLDWTNIFTKVFDESLARTDIIEALMQDDRVEEVSDVSFSRDNVTRLLSVDVTVLNTDGSTVNLEGVVLNAG
jgi:uncharacterized protein YabN with tetrapyrrole methylase and pyrophosphatase domain